MVDGCAAKFAKTLVFIINVCVWVVGFILIILGMVMIVQSDKYSYLFNEAENTLGTAAGIVIGIGCFVFLIGFCACWGTLKESVCFLKMYFVLIMLVVILKISASILAFVCHDGLTKVVKDTMDDAIAEDYDGEKNAATQAIDLVQKEFNCCGSTGISQWLTSKWAQDNEGLAPTSCCKRPKAENCNTDVANMHTDGCVDYFKNWLNESYLIVGGFCLGLLVFEILALFFTCCLITRIEKGDKVV